MLDEPGDPKLENAGVSTPAKFVWPPRKPVAISALAAPDAPKPTSRERSERPAQPNPSLRSALVTAKPVGGKLARAWSDIERVWLDVTAPPLAERMVIERWSPDTADDYCPRCGGTVDRGEVQDGECETCRAGEIPRPPWQRFIRLGEYVPPLNQWICEVKFTRWRRLGRDLGRLLGDEVVEQMNAAGFMDERPTIVPVPMSLRRRLARGIDHTLAVARGVADRTGGRIVQPLRRDHRPSQTRVLPSRREANAANSIHPRTAWIRPAIPGRLILVVDDVSTTTSTMRAACRAVAACLRDQRTPGANPQAPAPLIWAVALARTPPEVHDLHPADGEWA